jgi:hypothetical protein
MSALTTLLLLLPYSFDNGTACFKNVNICLNTNIYTNLETSGGQSSNLYLSVIRFFNASVNETSVAASESCFPALVSNTRCSIVTRKGYFFLRFQCNNLSLI